MNKGELASYLASLITIHDSFDDAGARLRPAWLSTEYTRAYDEFKSVVAKENEDARQSESIGTRGSKDGTKVPRDQSSMGGSNRDALKRP